MQASNQTGCDLSDLDLETVVGGGKFDRGVDADEEDDTDDESDSDGGGSSCGGGKKRS